MVISDQDLKKQQQRQMNVQGAKIARAGGLVSKAPVFQTVDPELDYTHLENVSKASLKRISADQLPKEVPDFKTPGVTKDSLVTEYLTKWITDALAAGKVKENDLLPRKEDIARHLGISVGTVQNAIRVIEDTGLLESKQRIGTMICNLDNPRSRMRKQTSKRDQAVIAVKKFISDRKFTPGDVLPSAREIAVQINSAPNTTRLALEFLTNQGTLKSRGSRGNKANWELIEAPCLESDPTITAIESETLIDQLERDLKKLIATSFEANDRLPSHLELAEHFKVSIKTVHDAMKRLSEQRVIRSKRGRYGTFVVRKPDTNFFVPAESIFVSVDDASFYNYEKVELHLKQLIKERYQVGDKLPAMGALAEELDVSSNTIRKALQNLAKENVVSFSRGRYGGTFVTCLPEVDGTTKPFTWVSINPETIRSYRQDKVAN